MNDLTHLIERLKASRDEVEFSKKLASLLCDFASASLVLWWEVKKDNTCLLGEHNVASAPFPLKLSEREHAEMLQEADRVEAPLRRSLEESVVFFAKFQISHSILFELIVPNDRAGISSDQEKVLQGLSRMKAIVDQSFKSFAVSPSIQGFDADQVVPFSKIVLSSSRLLQTAANVANELCRIHHFDRVSVARRKGRRWRVVAISNQAFVNRKSRAIRALEQLVDAAMQSKRTFRLNDQEYSQRIASRIESYQECNEVRSMVVFPINSQVDLNPIINEANERTHPLVAAIIVESFDSEVPCEIEEGDVYLEVSRSAIRNSLRYDNLPFVSVVEAYRSFVGVDGVSARRYRLGAITVVLLLCSLMLFLQADFYVSGKGRVIPVTRQRVYAEVDGVVSHVTVDHRSEVVKGELLVQLRNTDLEIESEKIAGDILELDEKLRALVASRVMNVDSKAADDRSIKGLRSQLETLRHLERTLSEKKRKLRIESPIEGQVVSWNVRETIVERPIQRGQVLLEISKLDGRWEAVVSMPIRKVGFIRDFGINDNPVIIAIPSRSEIWAKGKLRDLEIASRLEADGTQGVLAKVDLDERFDSEISNNLVVAKIYCGKKSLAFIWLHEVWYYVEENLIFPYWPF